MRNFLTASLHITIVACFCIANKAGAQNTFPSSGNVGIGTLSPSSILQVAGGDANINGIRVGRGNPVSFGNSIDSTNTCFGKNALESILANELSCNSTAIGSFALNRNTSGIQNTAIGAGTMKANKTGSYNVAVGSFALGMHRHGDGNIAIGKSALFGDTTGEKNVAVGQYALSGPASVGDNNIAIGYASLTSNSGSNNTTTGTYAAYSNTTGDLNTAFGYNCMYSNTTGDLNAAFGTASLSDNTSGIGNTALGYGSLQNNTGGDFNTALGLLSGPNTSSLNNATAIGYNSKNTAGNQVRIGNSSVSSIGGYTGWTNVSDGRIKRNIQENVPGLQFINELRPVTYNLNPDEADRITGVANNEEFKLTDESIAAEKNARLKKQQVVYTGFIAQDVEEAAKKLNYQFSGVDAPENTSSLYGLRYSEFVVPLVKAVQELSRANEEKDVQIAGLQKQIDELKTLVLTSKANNNVLTGFLKQNTPNPFSSTTTIAYQLPANFVKAKIIMTDKNGKVCKQMDASGSGRKIVSINTASLSAGTYQYSLFIDDRLVDTKQMIIANK